MNASDSQKIKDEALKKIQIILEEIIEEIYLRFKESSLVCYLEDIFVDKRNIARNFKYFD